jgi:hypothetical protein
MLSGLEVKSGISVKIGLLTNCTNTLSHVPNYIAVITCVNIF